MMTTNSPSAPDSGGGLLGRIDRAVAVMENVFNALAALFILIMMLFMVAEVLGRKLFNSPIPGAIDWVEVWMATFAFLGAAYCQRKGAHVRMELVIDRLKGRLLYWAECFAVFVGFVYVSIIAVQSFHHFQRAWERGDSTIDIRLELWPSKLIVPVALTLLALRLALQVWAYFRLAMDPERRPVAVPERHDAVAEAREEIEHAMGHDAHDAR